MGIQGANVAPTESELDEALARAVRQLITEAIEAETTAAV